jgi:hypothetical protein
MKHLYTLFATLALTVFAWAQYSGYGLFDNVATQRTSGPAGVRAVYHK